MPLTRDTRNDRRRRVLRENAREESSAKKAKTGSRQGVTNAVATARRSAGYSQDVRRACGHRLVQLIPVRKRTYMAAVAFSLLIPAVLATFHYLIYVSGQLNWYGHPLALTLDASYPRSLAAWLCGQLWLLCLGTTVLTFQLRRHKLDDYNGEYRLWFWLVLTCVLGSIEASTSFVSLFAAALNNWSTTNLGWSGPAVVKATVAVLVGMLGLRLCSELKSTPASVVFTLAGLICWGVSAALAQPEFTIDISPQVRIWLGATAWPMGLTCIWLAGLSYLRDVYIEAQQRFLSRQRALHQKHAAVPLKQRLQEAIPSFRRSDSSAGDSSEPRESRFKLKMPSAPQWMKREKNSADAGDSDSAEVKPAATSASKLDRGNGQVGSVQGGQKSARKASQEGAKKSDGPSAQPLKSAASAKAGNSSRDEHRESQDVMDDEGGKPSRFSMSGMFGRKQTDDGEREKRREEARAAKEATAQQRRSRKEELADGKDDDGAKRGGLSGWLRKPKDSDDAAEYKKVTKSRSDKQPATPKKPANNDNNGEGDERTKKSWFKMGMPKVSMPKVGLPKMKMPSVPSFRLKPPNEKEVGLRKTDGGPKPGTGGESSSSQDEQGDGDQGNARPLTKAERKRLRRMQQQNKAA